MCGLVAIINKLNNGFSLAGKENFTHMLYADAIRGMDSTGAFLVNNLGNVSWGKTKHNPVHLFITKEWNDLLDNAYKNGRFLVGHNRKATVGKVTDQTAHPFIEDNIILVHNGTLTNHKEIGSTEVDSHAICQSIAAKGHIETIKTLQGAFALIWYDINKKSLFVCRNDKRPLSFIETSDSYYLSSEAGLTKWMLGRNPWAGKITTETEIKVGTLYEFPVEDPEKYTETKLELHKQPSYLPTIYDQKKTPSLAHDFSKKTTTTTTETKAVPKYHLGQYVSLYIDDYDMYLEKQPLVKIYGATYDEHQTAIEIEYSDELLVYLLETENLIGKIKQIVYNPTTKIKTLILYPDSIAKGTILESKNKFEIDSSTWKQEKRICSKCDDPVEFYEVPETIVVKKNKKYILVCEQCRKNLKLTNKRVLNG